MNLKGFKCKFVEGTELYLLDFNYVNIFFDCCDGTGV